MEKTMEKRMDKLVEDMTKGFKLIEEWRRLELISKIRGLRKAERKRLDFLRNKLTSVKNAVRS